MGGIKILLLGWEMIMTKVVLLLSGLSRHYKYYIALERLEFKVERERKRRACVLPSREIVGLAASNEFKTENKLYCF
jgi:hypothetical protein